MWLSNEAKATLLAARQRQNGQALQVLTQPFASPYLLLHGQTCQAKAETLGLLRAERARVQQAPHGARPSRRVADGLWTPAQARSAGWLLRN
jgi:hypothetical protein